MTDTTWTVHTKSNGALEFDGAIGGSYPTLGAGKSASVTLYTRSIDDAALDTLREFARYSNDSTLTTGTRLDGSPWFSETIPPQADATSFLVRLDPGAGVSGLESWWCVIESAELETTPAGTEPRLTLELFVLGRFAEYGDRELVETDFESQFHK
jgi:hypothetical protein